MMTHHSRLRALLGGALLFTIVAACSDSTPVTPDPGESGAIRVAPAAASYAPGARVELDVTNDTTLYAHGDHCAQGLEREIAPNTWGRLSTYHDRFCMVFSSLFVVGPGESRTALAEIPEGAPRGRYRTYHEFVLSGTQVRLDGAKVKRHSEPFVVR